MGGNPTDKVDIAGDVTTRFTISVAKEHRLFVIVFVYLAFILCRLHHLSREKSVETGEFPGLEWFIVLTITAFLLRTFKDHQMKEHKDDSLT